MTRPLRLGIVGYGKIARDQHVAAIAATPGIELVAVATPEDLQLDVPVYRTLAAMLAGSPEVEAVALCQPPVPRFAAAREAIMAGRHVLLEKPPGVTPGEVEVLRGLAQEHGVSVFAAWHSRWTEDVAELRAWCAARRVTAVRIDWHEDVNVWHPGQAWICEPGGFGVFDPGINAISILTEVLPGPYCVSAADFVVPANWATPIAARVTLEAAGGAVVAADFDWRVSGPPVWRIVVEAGDERFVLSQGADVPLPGTTDESPLGHEYPALYAHFVGLVHARAIELDVEPLRIVADSFLRAAIRIERPVTV